MWRTNRVAALLGMLVVACCAAKAEAADPVRYGVKMLHVWIPTRDGTQLAANLFMPAQAEPAARFPAVFQYDPYRKDDNSWEVGAARPISEYFAASGYVSAQVDIRGTGQSEGHAPDREYSEQELRDGEDVIAWLARQPWSSGTVGMFGISWSGFNAIQLAMRNPPALKAIITAASTEKLYNEDCYYTDGIMTLGDGYNFGEDSGNAVSASPDFPTDEKTLGNRFDNPPWSLLWMRHQRESAFWHEPVRSLDSIRIPVFLIGSFVDGYRDTIPRWLTQLKSPVRALVGPWEHEYPHEADVGPDIEWRDLAVRWWDQWLKGKETGVTSEPKLAVYMRHWYPPDPYLTDIPGEWRNEASWPPRGQEIQSFYLQGNHSLDSRAPSATVHSLKYVPSVGIDAGTYWDKLTSDQRPLDAFSLVYDSTPLENERAILGMPEVRMRASTTARLADWIVRLCDVAPDGRVTLITGGALNAAQRESRTDPQDLQPNTIYSLRVPMRFTSWVFPPGHRIRLSISNAQWPMFWPTPYAMTSSLHLGGESASRLLLPTVPLASPLPAPHFNLIQSEVRAAKPRWTLTRSELGTPTIVEFGSKEYPPKPRVWSWGSYNGRNFQRFEVLDEHPEMASYIGRADSRVQLPNREVTWHTEWNVHSDRVSFYYLFRRELWENGRMIRERQWQETIPRDHQ